ncbi:hypothetical protein, partial [Xanthomonas campestris]|uniref:hypothetical protein n=1 Tax=Xanthomonas campestris TaxID=339 RepID=UPI0032E3C903
SARWTIILPAGVRTNYLRTLSKNIGNVASTPFPSASSFPSKRAAHYSGLFLAVNTSFRGG